MSLIQEIKAAQLAARKERRVDDASLLTTLIGEAEAVGKNNGNREVNDQEVVAMIKKFIKNIDEVIKMVDPDTDGYRSAVKEKSVLQTFLPSQLDEGALRVAMTSIISDLGLSGPKAMGSLMKEVKAKYDGQYDGAVASKLAKELLA